MSTQVAGLGPRAAGFVVLSLMAFAWAAGPVVAAPAGPRGYELVSSAAKNGFDVTDRGRHAASPDGNVATFNLNGVAPGSPSGGQSTSLSVRDHNTGWATRYVDPPIPPGAGLAPRFLTSSADFTKSLVWAFSALTPGATDSSAQLYVRDNTDGSYRLITPYAPPPSPSNQTAFDGNPSPDYTRVAYESNLDQLNGDPLLAGIRNVYEWVDGKVRLVGVLPNGQAAPEGSRLGSSPTFGSARDAASRDGRRIVFHAIDLASLQTPNPQGSTSGQLYVREDDGTGAAHTIHVSGSRRTDCAGDPTCGGDNIPDPAPDPAGPLPATYVGAEGEHGSKVLFLSCEQLTDDSTAKVGSDCERGDQAATMTMPQGLDLYRYDVDTDDLTDLTTTDANGANVFGVVGSSEDLSRIYFVAGGNLASGATAGQPNLFLWENGSLTFIATLDPSVPDPSSTAPDVGMIDFKNWSLVTANKQWSTRTTPDGKHLLFTSRAHLKGYDSSNPACSTGSCAEVFLYDAEKANLTCVSCNVGGPTLGNARLSEPTKAVTTSGVDPLARNLSDDGRRVYFEARDRLAKGDSNGEYDVYEWRDGERTLISGGRSATDSLFVDASVSGDDVFFTTLDRLVGADVDLNRDLYDARVNGGFQEPQPPAPPCHGDECQGPNVGAPAFGAPGSLGVFSGNVRPGIRPAVRVGRLSRAARTRLARGRAVRLKVRVNRAGRVSLVATAIAGKKRRVFERALKRAKRRGTISFKVKLTKGVRKLGRSHKLRVSVAVRFAGAEKPKPLVLNLKPTRKGR